jgi:hypothetical protein
MANVTTSFMKVFTGDASRSGVFEDEIEAIIMASCIHGVSEDWLQWRADNRRPVSKITKTVKDDGLGLMLGNALAKAFGA